MSEHPKIEHTVRAGLAQAAQEADGRSSATAQKLLDSSDTTAPTPRHRRRYLIAAAGVAAAIAGGFGVHHLLSPPVPEDGVCDFVVEFEGRQFGRTGDPFRIPTPGDPIGTATLLPCGIRDDAPTHQIDLYSVPGVDPSLAAMDLDGGIYFREDLRTRPRKLFNLDKPVPCRLPAGTEVRGEPLSARNAAPASTWRVELPYVARLHITAEGMGETYPFTPYSAVDIPVHVTSDTAGGDSEGPLIDALHNGGSVIVTVACDGRRYQASQVATAP